MSRKVQSMSVGSGREFSTCNMGFRHLTSLDFGRIQPLVVQECVANDTVKLNMCELNISNAPLGAPLQGRFQVNLAAFYVRNRVIWDKWNAYITRSEELSIPSFNPSALFEDIGNLDPSYKRDAYAFHSSLGLDPNNIYYNYKTDIDLNFSILPYRAIQRIWFDYFRDSTVIPDSAENLYIHRGSESEGYNPYILPKYACWKPDFLTNTLRKPFSDERYVAIGTPENTANYGASWFDEMGNSIPTIVGNNGTSNSGNGPSTYQGDTSLNVVEENISRLRVANHIQNYIEKMNAVGSRMRDKLRSLFGASVQAESLNMAEFLDDAEFFINVDNSPSNQSSSTQDLSSADFNSFGVTDITKGNLKGQLSGVTSLTQNGIGNINYHCPEHGFFVVLAWVMPDVMECQGISPMWYRGVDGYNPNPTDFLHDDFTKDGVEPLPMIEVCLPHSEVIDFDPFVAVGYRAKYETYRYNKDIVSGTFVDPISLSSMRNWYLQRDFLREANLVDQNGSPVKGKDALDVYESINHDTLSQMTEFSSSVYDEKFIISNAKYDHFVCQCKVDLEMVRPLPGIVAPSIDTVTSAPTHFGGTRL